jgi:hypothetical protein
MSQDSKQNFPKDRPVDDDDIKPDYDFSRGLRGVHAYRFSKLSADEAMVLGYWTKEGFDVGSFSKNEMRDLKTPDLRLSREGTAIALCEVKSFQRDHWLEEQIKKAPPGALAGGLRPDPIFNRISNAIHTAYKQFECVNPDHRLLNFLFLINHDTSAKPEDLDRVLTGFENPRRGILEPTCAPFSEGRIRLEKTKIDLYVWLDWEPAHEMNGREYKVLGNPETRLRVCELLRIEPSRVRIIPSAA